MRIATWNVNSVKQRVPRLLPWLEERAPDVVCLQETKLEDHNFPQQAIEAAGYQVAYSGQKTYNGVALLARQPIGDVVCGNPRFADPQKRLIGASVGDVRVVCAYVPNGQAVGSDKFAYKMAWLEALTAWLKAELVATPQLVLAGDYNVAPEDRDAHPDWKDEIHVSVPERDAFKALLGLGLTDAFRLFEQDERSFSWWDYRMMAFRRNVGLRIDHLLLSAPLAEKCSACFVDKTPRKLERPSDHAPVVVEIAS